MNEMTRQPSAARLSEDIGDVLSAIRRLIAEDEALSTARDHREEERAAHLAAQGTVRVAGATGGEVLAGRYGGNAALARRMALGMGLRRPHAVETAEGESGEERAAYRYAEEPAALPEAPAVHPFEAAFDADSFDEDALDGNQAFALDEAEAAEAETDEAAGDEIADLAGETVAPLDAPVLRLRDSDRVISLSGSAITETSAELNRILPWRAWSQSETATPVLTSVTMFVPDTVPVEPVLSANPTVMIVEDDEDVTDAPVMLTSANRDADAMPELETGEDQVSADVVTDDSDTDIRIEPVAEAALDDAPPHVADAQNAAVSAAVDVGDVQPEAVPVDEEAADVLPEVALSPLPQPVPDAVLRPRASRWARIEPPVTRRRVVPVADDQMAPAPLAFAATPLALDMSASALTEPASLMATRESAHPIPLAVRLARSLRGERVVALTGTAPEPEQFAPVETAPVAEAVVQGTTANAAADPRPQEPAALVQGVAEEGAAQVAAAEPDASQQAGIEVTAASDLPNEMMTERDAILRDLVRSTIQEELHGELGQRFARNLRAVIRREVAAALDSQLDRL